MVLILLMLLLLIVLVLSSGLTCISIHSTISVRADARVVLSPNSVELEWGLNGGHEWADSILHVILVPLIS
jgi:hypothetical protein